jgi:GNAT superfamily N-acetyltransferase
MKIKNGNTLFIDVIANDKKYRGQGIGGALLRYAENLGRSLKLGCIELWSIEDQISNYRDKGQFHVVEGEPTIDAGNNERYTLMRRPLLYHFNLTD